jgi:putative solute:sodium symporter small subunit
MPVETDEPDTRPVPAEYWRRNLRYLAVLLTIWFAVSYGAGILFADTLDRLRIPGTGFPLGFWFAQQGSIYVFVALIFVYVTLMNRLDREFDVDEEEAGRRRWRRAHDRATQSGTESGDESGTEPGREPAP